MAAILDQTGFSLVWCIALQRETVLQTLRSASPAEKQRIKKQKGQVSSMGCVE